VSGGIVCLVVGRWWCGILGRWCVVLLFGRFAVVLLGRECWFVSVGRLRGRVGGGFGRRVC
jgi:hypothetical protein